MDEPKLTNTTGAAVEPPAQTNEPTEPPPAAQSGSTAPSSVGAAGEGNVANPASQGSNPAQATGLMGAEPSAQDTEPPAQGTEPSVLGAPEKYDFTTDAEGVELDPSVMSDFGDVAKELNLSQDAAQKIVSKMAPTMAKQHQATIQRLRGEWENACRADSEFGGAKFDANLKGIREAYARYTTPELRTLMGRTGLDSHPEMLRLFHRLAVESGEGRFVGSSGGSGKSSGGDITDFYVGMKP